MKLPRTCGILLHPTSLPSPFGIGDFGEEAFRFADRLKASGQGLWQMLPLGPASAGDSPYQSFSAFAGNPLLISPELLVREGYLSSDDLSDAPRFPAERVDYESVRQWKVPLLTAAYRKFRDRALEDQKRQFQAFCSEHKAWLEDYALFMALRQQFGSDQSWTAWDRNLVKRDATALKQWRRKLKDQIECEKFQQFEFYRQWDALRKYSNECGILIMGDIPIYVSHESADVWAHPEQFCLDEDGRPTEISGVPPDYFSETGQLWGNPIYRWSEMERSGFEWWLERLRGIFRLFDLVRLDHFRGFEAYWSVPAVEETAVNGQWIKAPGAKLFRTAREKLGELRVVAENLGDISPEVEQMRRQFGFPGMAVLQFGFGTDPQAATFRPHNFERELFAYTGTHDNDTVMGWWNSEGGDSTRTVEDVRKEKAIAQQYLGPSDEPINWKLIRVLFGSIARLAIVPMQDVLGLGSESRMNMPGVARGNWGWRMTGEAFRREYQERLRGLAEIYERVPG
ncbi:MAG TPA: 4-alpha-glucanotransferase [Bryobacteraceae bacterium]|nr:4-alpha-glucanotransferase [Bryobacteraceae bacterium]